tara:strand:- start:48 stop:1016 length:969 start_codon:yes stop_codon:yes gene_type:complete
MAIPIKKFGQYVKVQIHSEDGQLVFETDSLKIDFDVRNKAGWERGKFTITNLNPDTIRKISDANNANYITIWTALHDSKLSLLVNNMYISNALEEINVPNSIFSIYGYSKLRKEFLEKQIDIQVLSPSLAEMVGKAISASGFKGELEFKFFPEEKLFHTPTNPKARLQGSLLSVLEVLGDQFNFNLYTEGARIILMYKPVTEDVDKTTLLTGDADITLSTDNMRSNPKIGPANLSIVSNLEPLIKPSSVLDISKLLTIGTDVPEETLKITEDYLQKKIAGFSKYQVLSTQHKGSNWSGDWSTQAVALSPTKGTTMSSSKWWA